MLIGSLLIIIILIVNLSFLTKFGEKLRRASTVWNELISNSNTAIIENFNNLLKVDKDTNLIENKDLINISSFFETKLMRAKKVKQILDIILKKYIYLIWGNIGLIILILLLF